MRGLDNTRQVWAEPNDDRLLARLTRVTQGEMSSDELASLIAGDLAVIERLSPALQQAVLALVRSDAFDVLDAYEHVQGNTVDFVPIAYLDQARLAARSVGRVIFRAGAPQGTGILVSNRLLLTNNHVAESPEQAMAQAVQFNFERDVLGRPVPVSEFALDPDLFFVTSDKRDLDYTLVGIGQRLGGASALDDFGFRRLSGARDKHAEGDFVSIVQHPSGDYKQIVLRENRVLGRSGDGKFLYYGTDTLPGSSGSPVFNDQYELVALHHAGRPTSDGPKDDGALPARESNEGIRVSTIVADLERRRSALTADQQHLLDEAMKQIDTDDLSAPVAAQPNGDVATPTAAQSMSTVPAAPGVARVTVPVEITVPLPEPSSDPRATMWERNQKPDGHYERRHGYDPEFLDVEVGLPSMTPELRRLAAKRLDDDAHRLDYEHFSIVVHAKRRMPIYTAVNIEGSTWKQINRDTRVVTDPFEAAETWYADPRLDPGHQLSQHDYDAISHLFDRGHMVRREDPQWGNRATALLAMDDTFHFTNSCPQNWRFNQRATFWQGIENYVLNAMIAAPERVSVFTGPIFTTRDPTYEGVKVPKAFWKIVARVADGKLRATGFIASQQPIIDDVREALRPRAWIIDPEEPVAGFQARISEVERRANLRFPSRLRSADTFEGDFEAAGAEAMHPIDAPAAVSW